MWVPPRLPAHAKKTYSIAAPLGSHWRQATCAEVECAHWRNGWRTLLNPKNREHRDAADWIRTQSGRRFTERRTPEGLVEFVFPAGQACYEAAGHRVRLAREPLYVVRGGDFRGNPRRERRLHQRPEDWVEDFSEHQDRLATIQQQG